MRDDLRYRVAGWTGGLALDALLGTATFEVREGDQHRVRFMTGGDPCIYALWHGRLLPLTYLYRGRGIVALVSRSGDGEYIARVLRHWGYRTARGSSTRGGSAALREMVRHARAGGTIAFTPDGPTGPRQRLKPGALAAAQATGLPVVPMAAGTDRAWWVKSWDRFLIPKPFARIRVAYGEPQFVPRDAAPDEVDHHARCLELELNRIMEIVDGELVA